MADFKITIPTNQVARAFEKTVSPLHAKIVANVHETRVLGNLRDILLPNLVSGKLGVSRAERILEKTA